MARESADAEAFKQRAKAVSEIDSKALDEARKVGQVQRVEMKLSKVAENHYPFDPDNYKEWNSAFLPKSDWSNIFEAFKRGLANGESVEQKLKALEFRVWTCFTLSG